LLPERYFYMTTRTEVAADSPQVYFYFDEASGAFVNHGSLGGSSSNTGNLTYSQAAPSRVGQGTAISMNPTVVTYAQIGGNTFVSGTTWTFETWVKRSTMTNPWVRIIGNIYAGSSPTSATDYAEIAIVDDSATLTTGSLRLYDQASGTQVTFTHPTISDLNWHHVAVVNNAGSVTLYVDGVSIGTGTMTCASKTGNVIFGTRSIAGTAFSLDEGAFTKTALSASRIAAHAGSISITATPPVMTASLTEVAPAFAGPIIDKTVVVPAMALSLATPPAAFAQILNATDDRIVLPNPNMNGQSASSDLLRTATTLPIQNTGNTNRYAGIKFAAPFIPAGASFAKATLTLPITISSVSGAGVPVVTVYKATSAWTEAGAETVAWDFNTYVRVNLANATTVGENRTVDIDVTSLLGTDGSITNGFVIDSYAGYDNFSVYTKESSTPAYIAYEVKPATVISAPVITVTLDTVTPTVSAGANVTNTAPVMTADLAFIGGEEKNPDYATSVPAITVSLSAPNAGVSVEYPNVISVPAIYVGNLENEIASISLTTNRLAVAPAITLSLKWPGIYFEQADRYLTKVAETTDSDDIWYKMGTDIAGATRASDALGGNQDGYYFGAPTFGVDGGPSLRKVVHFNGINDYLIVGPYTDNASGTYSNSNSLNAGMAASIEFSIRTTQLNGTVFNARGGSDGSAAAINPNVDALPKIDRKVVLKDGYLQLVSPTETLKVRTNFIADGEWHHVVIGLPNTPPTGTAYDQQTPYHVTIDGQPAVVRYGALAGGFAYNWLPYSFMANVAVKTSQLKPVIGGAITEALAGDLRDVIVRLHKAVTRAEAQELYYEWSNSSIAQPEAIVLNLSMVDPIKARGNTKRMLAVYGLPYGYTAQGQTGGNPLFTYMSALSGFLIENFNDRGVDGWPHVVNSNSFNGGISYLKPKVFRVGDYTVYPVSIIGDGYGDSTGLTSADGVLNSDAVSQNGRFIDDRTGLPRFINLQDDLAEDVTDFDVVTVVNYPWVRPDGATITETAPTVPTGAAQIASEGILYQHSMGLSNTEWEAARDALRDSILEASYEGVNLWIGEYHMAQHLGFIGAVDIHSDGKWLSSGPGTGIGPNDNVAAHDIDLAHLTAGTGWDNWFDMGGYMSYGQVNTYRRIVAEVEDLTDIPSNEISKIIEGYADDVWKPNGSFMAYDIIRRPNGLQVGDLSLMPVTTKWGSTFDTTTDTNYSWGDKGLGLAPYKRWSIISARPEGIIGRVISREQESYYGPGGVVVSNPYKDNAYTIAVERGSVVRGRPIRGRAFIELMEAGTDNDYLAEDLDQNKWQGNSTTSPVSTWAFDTRRYKEIKVAINSVKWRLSGGELEGISTSFNYFTYEDGTYRRNLTWNWHRRGLNWLAHTPETDGNDYIAYATPVTVTLTSPNPAFSRTASPVSQVIGAMRLDMEIRQPDNYKDGTVVERTLPMELSLDVRGIGTSVTVPPMELTLSAAAPVIEADTEVITVYLDNTNSVTLFLKEDN
jgi:hypothetical protein